MNLPVVVDITLGLVFIYLILSLLASEIQEIIATLLQWRVKHLKSSIELLLAGGSESGKSDIINAIKLVRKLYDDPLINTLNQQAKGKVEKHFREITKNPDKQILEKQSGPSYLPSETFAITLLDTLKIPQLINYVKHPSEEVKTNLHMILASYKELKKGINNPTSASYQKIKEIYGDIDQKFIDFVNDEIPNEVPDNLIKSLGVIAQRSRIKVGDLTEEINQFKNEVETWFDRSMDRASGVYKRNAKGVAILIGILVAFLTNTDTFHLVKRLSQDSVIRSTITQSASQKIDYINDQEARKEIEKLLGNASVPIGWQNINQQFELLDRTESNRIYIRASQVFKLICGWIVSGLAIAMGAPFWFDILNKVVNVRNAGPKPVAYTKDQPPQK
ncbi:prominin family protein [Nostoc sp. CHAB 5784]|uniref:prominin family protein n=1 Tax=Nostoc mirabile TaxID=2907820 RepID=UPI001E3B4B95|nr:prominin family protein [Nostoc mirabile]MCC5668079.1 prominin family protein [Nostoc mirabile CHAB5784]